MKNAILLCCCLLSVLAAAAPAISADAAKPTFTLRSRRAAGQTDRVAVLMEVGGEFKERAEGKQQRTPMSGVDKLTYQEMTLEAGRDRLRAVRYYEKAESAVKFKDDALNSSLSPQRRLVGVAVDPPADTPRPPAAALHTTLFALRGPLRREELEVIDVLGNSLLLDDLLPDGPTAVGQTWKPADKVVAALLGLDAASRCDVQCTLKEVTDAVARFELAGQVEGPVNDTTARVQLKGKYRFDRRTGPDRLVRLAQQGGPGHQPGGRRLRGGGPAADDDYPARAVAGVGRSQPQRLGPRTDARADPTLLSTAGKPLAHQPRPPLVLGQRRPRRRRAEADGSRGP